MENKLIYGAVIGDILGSLYEFSYSPSEKAPNYTDFEFDIQKANYTDDTVMTFAVAVSLLSHKDVSTCMRDIAKLYPCPKGGYGGRFKQWLFREDMGPYHSCGNGAGMRVSPVAYFANSEEECKQLAKMVTEVTHDHEEGLKGAEVVSMMIYYALHGKDKAFLKEYASSQYDVDFDIEDLHLHYFHEETCQRSVPQALFAFLSSTSFEDCLRRVCYIGGDSDTTGAMACAIASAYYKDIPQKFLDLAKQKLPSHMVQIFDSVPLNI